MMTETEKANLYDRLSDDKVARRRYIEKANRRRNVMIKAGVLTEEGTPKFSYKYPEEGYERFGDQSLRRAIASMENDTGRIKFKNLAQFGREVMQTRKTPTPDEISRYTAQREELLEHANFVKWALYKEGDSVSEDMFRDLYHKILTTPLAEMEQRVTELQNVAEIAIHNNESATLERLGDIEWVTIN